MQYLGELGAEVKVVRNDQITIKEVALLKPNKIVISPGPCTPNEAGISVALISKMAGKIPILGVCLGHQSIGRNGALGEVQQVIPQLSELLVENKPVVLWLIEGQVLS